MALSNILRCYSQQPQAQSPCQPMGRDYDLREVDVHDPAPGSKGSLGQSYAVLAGRCRVVSMLTIAAD